MLETAKHRAGRLARRAFAMLLIAAAGVIVVVLIAVLIGRVFS
jgi:hypothetical protein